MTALAGAVLSNDPTQQSQIYANLNPAIGRFISLPEDEQEDFRGKLTGYCSTYAFVAQVMPWTDAELERLFLYGKLLLTELPAPDTDPMPQLSKSVLLSHLRLAITNEGSLALEASEDPGVALPGEGKGSATEPVLDKLSELIEVMNEKYGANLDESDKIWIDQQWTAVMEDDDLNVVANHNDRGQYDLVLTEKVQDVLLDRHEKNGELTTQFFVNLDFRQMLLGYLGGTYDEFRKQADVTQ